MIKNFSLGNVKYGFTLQVQNIFNKRNVLEVDLDTGTWNGDGSDVQSDIARLSDPRQILVGFFASF